MTSEITWMDFVLLFHKHTKCATCIRLYALFPRFFMLLVHLTFIVFPCSSLCFILGWGSIHHALSRTKDYFFVYLLIWNSLIFCMG